MPVHLRRGCMYVPVLPRQALLLHPHASNPHRVAAEDVGDTGHSFCRGNRRGKPSWLQPAPLFEANTGHQQSPQEGAAASAQPARPHVL